MDRYIRMLMLSLSRRYRVVLLHKMFYSEDKGKLVNVFSLTIWQGKKRLLRQDFFSKREVVLKLSEWEK